MLNKYNLFAQQTTDSFDPAILIGKQIFGITITRRKEENDFIKILFSDDSYIEFFLNTTPDVFYMEPEIWSRNENKKNK